MTAEQRAELAVRLTSVLAAASDDPDSGTARIVEAVERTLAPADPTRVLEAEAAELQSALAGQPPGAARSAMNARLTAVMNELDRRAATG